MLIEKININSIPERNYKVHVGVRNECDFGDCLIKSGKHEVLFIKYGEFATKWIGYDTKFSSQRLDKNQLPMWQKTVYSKEKQRKIKMELLEKTIKGYLSKFPNATFKQFLLSEFRELSEEEWQFIGELTFKYWLVREEQVKLHQNLFDSVISKIKVVTR
jgi:hypothetical protein